MSTGARVNVHPVLYLDRSHKVPLPDAGGVGVLRPPRLAGLGVLSARTAVFPPEADDLLAWVELVVRSQVVCVQLFSTFYVVFSS